MSSIDPRVCQWCLPWCATTRSQYRNRIDNLAAYPASQPYPCPKCGGQDWATTDRYVIDREEEDELGGMHPITFLFLAAVAALVIALVVVYAAGWWLGLPK